MSAGLPYLHLAARQGLRGLLALAAAAAELDWLLAVPADKVIAVPEEAVQLIQALAVAAGAPLPASVPVTVARAALVLLRSRLFL